VVEVDCNIKKIDTTHKCIKKIDHQRKLVIADYIRQHFPALYPMTEEYLVDSENSSITVFLPLVEHVSLANATIRGKFTIDDLKTRSGTMFNTIGHGNIRVFVHDNVLYANNTPISKNVMLQNGIILI